MTNLIELSQQALRLTLTLSLPVMGIALAVGALVAILQAATQIHDYTLAHLPRFIAVAIGLALLGPWMGEQLVQFAARSFAGG